MDLIHRSKETNSAIFSDSMSGLETSNEFQIEMDQSVTKIQKRMVILLIIEKQINIPESLKRLCTATFKRRLKLRLFWLCSFLTLQSILLTCYCSVGPARCRLDIKRYQLSWLSVVHKLVNVLSVCVCVWHKP